MGKQLLLTLPAFKHCSGLMYTMCRGSPICLIQDYDFVPAWRQRHLFLRKHLDLVAHHVYAPAAATAAFMQTRHMRIGAACYTR
jgi:hypothetical protein